MIKPAEISNLLSSVTRLIAHQKEIEQLKGEQFNIFSILRMERSENKTHSAFLSELLNQDGTHQKGAVFLKLFLRSVNLPDHLSIETSHVAPEYFIGERNDLEKTGGRVDILIKDEYGSTITIENKIDADDQYVQIERYCNYNKGANKVFYLTLDGREPAADSKGKLVSGQDYFLLSYKNDIVKWLEHCLKEAADAPMLRESIKQYIILIKKMTSSPDNQHEIALLELIANNYEAAAFVSSGIVKARQRIADGIRNAVLEKLKHQLPSDLTACIGDPIDHRYAQIWIWHRNYSKPQLKFGIESFSGTGNFGGNLFVGIFNHKMTANTYTNQFPVPATHWYEEVPIEFESAKINFSNNATILKIQSTPGFKERLTDQITTQVVNYILRNEGKILDHLKAMSDAIAE